MMKGNRFQVLGYSLLFFLLSTVTCTLYPTFAADSTPSADPLRQSDSEASIKSKLVELEKEIASKAAKLKQQISGKLANKSYIGKVKAGRENTITIATINGPKLININLDTGFESNVKRKKYSQKLISEEDYLAALGDVDETGVLTAKKIILLPTPNSELKTYLWGQIVAISAKLITLKDRDLKTQAVSVDNIGAIKLSDFVIFTGIIGKNNVFEAEFAYVIPQGGILKPKKIASPSAKISSPSAKPASKKAN